MKLTDRIKKRFADYKADTNQSLYAIHREIIDNGDRITYPGLREFLYGDGEGSGNTINIIDNFLSKRGY